jgi:hypothetical protein
MCLLRGSALVPANRARKRGKGEPRSALDPLEPRSDEYSSAQAAEQLPSHKHKEDLKTLIVQGLSPFRIPAIAGVSNKRRREQHGNWDAPRHASPTA